jgi:hypothetical protein
MYIITDENNIIIHISETIGYQENGNVLVDNETLAIAKPLVKEVYEVESIDDGIEEAKYCYTEEKGFYKNPDYREYFSEEDRISANEDYILDLDYRISMLELGLGGEV